MARERPSSSHDDPMHKKHKPMLTINSITPDNVLLYCQEDPSKSHEESGQPAYLRLTYNVLKDNYIVISKILFCKPKYPLFNQKDQIAYDPNQADTSPKPLIINNDIYINSFVRHCHLQKSYDYEHIQELSLTEIWKGLKTFTIWVKKEGYLRKLDSWENLRISIAVAE
jgi:hypothetical protein